MIYFSKSTNGFFFDGINSDMPADIVEISTDLYNELIAGQQEGGKLILGDISSTDKEKLSAWMDYKKEVKAVDTSTAPEISWPELPEV